jgi:glycerol kinase
MNPDFLALDQRSTSSCALIFDADGRLLAAAQRELTQPYPNPVSMHKRE